MMEGCLEARSEVTILEIACPACGANVEAFDVDGRLRADAKCEECGHIIRQGTPVDELECK